MRKPWWGLLALLGLTGSCGPRAEAPGVSTKASTLGVPAPIAYRVKDLNPGPGDGLPERLKPHFYLHALGSTLFLRADDGVGGPALWRSDGTEAGTRLVKDFTPDAEDGLGDEPAVLDGALYFFADAGSDLGLWKMTESAEEPSLVLPLAPRGQGPTYYLRAFGAHLSFVHTAAETGTEPWISDGTADGTRLLADIRPGAESSDPRFFRMLGDTLTFAASDGVHGNELWRSDVAEGAVQVLDIHPTGDGLRQYESDIEAIGGTLYFSADDGVHDAELWSSDGTAEGTRLFKDLWPGGPGTSQNSSPGDFTQVGSTIFFTAWNEGFGRELWKTDGTPEGTVRLQELRQGSPGEVLGGLVALNGRLVFIARGTYPHAALWASDGTEAGTVMLKELDVQADNLYGYQVLGGLLVFRGDDGVHGKELWRSDGTPEGTFMVADVRPGPESSDASHFALAGDTLYFRATDGVSGYEPWAIPMAKVHDPLPPSLTCPADVAVDASSSSGAVVSYPAATASDNSAGPLALSYSNPSGSTFPVGTTQVVITAKDAAQNSTGCTFQVTVRESRTPPPGEELPEGVSACTSGPGAANGTWLALLSLLAFTRMRRRRSGSAEGA